MSPKSTLKLQLINFVSTSTLFSIDLKHKIDIFKDEVFRLITSLPRRKAVFFLKGCSLIAKAPSAISTPHISQSLSSYWSKIKTTHIAFKFLKNPNDSVTRRFHNTPFSQILGNYEIRPWGKFEHRRVNKNGGNGREKRNHGYRKRWNHGDRRGLAP